MGLPRPFKPPKSPTSVMADAKNAPPVFTKHMDLHKGQKPEQQHRPAPPPSTPKTPPHQHQRQPHVAVSNGSTNKVAPSPSRNIPVASNHTAGSGTGNSTSSTSLWIAQADAEAANHKPSVTNRIGSQSDHSGAQSSYYEEEVVSDDDDDAFFEDAAVGTPQSDRSDLSGTELNLFPEHVSTIRFDEYDEMQTVLHINDYTKHEINKTWYKREDYDKMVKLARKTAEKAEERRKELEEIARQKKRERLGLPPTKKGGEEHHPNHSPQDSVSQRSHRSTTTSSHHRRSKTVDDSGDGNNQDGDMDGHDEKGDALEKKPIEYRGLEAWTASGAAKVKILKESAIELVWNEQSRQWDAGLFDPDAIRNVYIAVSQTAAAAALERGKSDEAIVKRLKELEALEAEKKRRRRLLGKSKALVKKSVQLTGRGVKQTGKIMQKTTKKTTKLAKDVTKRGVKAGVATATLDPRMMKEALKVSMKKRECKHETIIRPSNARIQEESEKQSSGRDVTPSNSFDESDEANRQQYEGADESSVEVENDHSAIPGKKKKSKLKLLGVVPIPGTKKVYKEDRREKKAEKRIQKQSRRPSWEAGVSTGKY
ncbi:hypothetical protein IV203_019802 [Nitzschia inconspicua]|uniref:Uncharacterized protein n=1 Tax=Nitzschia inconspicua TaxID=303405 RepID=A0A9K3Q4M8_9STRA|nr:hypothetical protein IV203_019802 [Nitzschia inconspicua]